MLACKGPFLPLSVLLLLAQERPVSCEITGFAQQLHQSRLRLCPLLGMSLSPMTPLAVRLQLTFQDKDKPVPSRLLAMNDTSPLSSHN